MECWGVFTTTAAINCDLNFPVPFANASGVVVTGHARDAYTSYARVLVFGTPTDSDVSVSYIRNDGGASYAAPIMWKAIGRWQSATNMVGDYTYGQGIVETITNSNGTAIKFDNGTMICRWSNTNTSTANSGYGYLFAAPGVLWTYPAAFISTPTVIASADARSSICSAESSQIGTTSVTLYLFSGTNGGYGYLQAIATGNWK